MYSNAALSMLTGLSQQELASRPLGDKFVFYIHPSANIWTRYHQGRTWEATKQSVNGWTLAEVPNAQKQTRV